MRLLVWGYRNFESFRRILATLAACGYAVDYRHINAADYGVPQTRKRLVLRAVRGGRVPPLHPTHRKGGDMFYQPWIGWYAAIEDLLDTLPETTPAPWQLARLPAELRETLLIGPGGYDGTVVQAGVKSPHGDGLVLRARDEPATTVVSADEGRIVTRAFLIQSKNTSQEWGKGYWEDGEPAPTVVSDRKPSHMPRAYLVGGGNTQLAQVDSHARPADEPAFTVRDGANGSPERAYLLDGPNGRPSHGRPQIVGADDPAYTIGANKAVQRAYVGRWVRMSIRALGRFQTVPDDYIGLTPTINGNGVPCRLARAIMESLQEIAR